jgi:hypothetical protein
MSKILSSAASVIALSLSFVVVGSDSTLAHEVQHRHRLPRSPRLCGSIAARARARRRRRLLRPAFKHVLK